MQSAMRKTPYILSWLAASCDEGRGAVRSSALLSGLSIAVLLMASVACSAMEPALSRFAASTPTAGAPLSWSVVEIEKPTSTPLAEVPTPTEEPDAGPAAVPTAATEELPVITMVIVEDESQPPISEVSPEEGNAAGKYVLVSLGEQHLYAYENGQLIYSFVASTGMGNSTRVGSFTVLDKIPSAYGANWNIWMPNWLGIYWSGSLENGIHALPILPGGGRLWSGYLGTPISYGCVVLGVEEALQLYEWADVGTPVDIQW